jgi:Protein of unknown function (DUF4199)
MKPAVLRFGLYSTLLIVALGLFNYYVLARFASYPVQEVAGYLAMLLSMIFVFMGIRHYRDAHNGGALSFAQGLKVGVLIVLIPALLFGLFDLFYTKVLNPGWQDDYYNNYMQQLRNSTPPEKLEAALAKAAREKETFSNPFMLFLVMSGTVFIIGLIVTVISSLTLRRASAIRLHNTQTAYGTTSF